MESVIVLSIALAVSNLVWLVLYFITVRYLLQIALKQKMKIPSPSAIVKGESTEQKTVQPSFMSMVDAPLDDVIADINRRNGAMNLGE